MAKRPKVPQIREGGSRLRPGLCLRVFYGEEADLVGRIPAMEGMQEPWELHPDKYINFRSQATTRNELSASRRWTPTAMPAQCGRIAFGAQMGNPARRRRRR